MAAFAYVLLPVTGVVAYFGGRDRRARFHGLQAVTYGSLWPLFLYGASLVSPVVTQIVFAAGLALWLALLIGAARGRDPKIPVIGAHLERLADASPRGEA
jgi:uncharacterized membrane protein